MDALERGLSQTNNTVTQAREKSDGCNRSTCLAFVVSLHDVTNSSATFAGNCTLYRARIDAGHVRCCDRITIEL